MRFKVWLITHNIKSIAIKIHNNTYFVWLRNTLFFNMVKVFILVVIMLIIIFNFAPKTAHISYIADNNIVLGNIKAERANLKLVTNRFIIHCDNEIVLSIRGSDGIYIDDEIYDNSYNIKYIPFADTDYGGDIFFSHPGFDEFDIEVLSFYEFDNLPIFINYMTSDFTITSQTGFQLSQDILMHLTFTNGNAYLVKDGLDDIPFTYCRIQNKENSQYLISIKDEVQINVLNYKDYFANSSGDIAIFGINTLSAKSYGNVIYSYSPTPVQYTLNNQIINMVSDNCQLQANIVFSNTDIDFLDVNGMLNEAIISGMNLFPSFFGWYRNSIYLAPITLLTTIFGGVTLMINNRKGR